MDDGRAPTALPPRFEAWFAARGWRPRAHQLAMLEEAGPGATHALLIAPTGGGKTLAGFLPSLIELAERPAPNAPPRRAHPLHLAAEGAGGRRRAQPDGADRRDGPADQGESRTGDTGVARRQRQRVKPPDILLTTPEQLALFCAWEGARRYFEDLAA